MKKIIFLIATMCAVCSCTTITCIGNVTAYNADGSVLEKWEDVEISSADVYSENSIFKSFGINFYDIKSDKFIVVGNAVPCIIEYTVSNKQETVKTKEESIDKYYNKYSKQQLIDEYKTLGEYVANAREKLSTLDKNSTEYQSIKEDIKQARIKQKLIYFICLNKYGIELNTIIK